MREARVLVSTFSEVDPYICDTYLQQEGLYDTKTKLIFDTNVFRRVVKLAQGKEANNEDVVPAAVMAFAACARLITAPALSLYEEVASNKLKGPNKDLAYFLAGTIYIRENGPT